jgi:hypothetical protein
MVWKLLNKKRISNETSQLGQRPGDRLLLNLTEGRECPQSGGQVYPNWVQESQGPQRRGDGLERSGVCDQRGKGMRREEKWKF